MKHVHVVILKEPRYLHYMFVRFLVITNDDKYRILHFLFMVVMRVTENASITLNVFFLYNFILLVVFYISNSNRNYNNNNNNNNSNDNNDDDNTNNC